MKRLIAMAAALLAAGTPAALAESYAAPAKADGAAQHGAADAKAAGHAPHWTYSGEAGPARWGDLAPEFAACKTGKNQSPVDISNAVDSDSAPLEFRYGTATVDFVNNGHTLQQNFSKEGSYITLGNTRYDLLQFHFHSPSENTLKGRALPLEAHLVHKSADGGLAVVGVFFEAGAENETLKTLWSAMPAAGAPAVKSDAPIKPAALLPQERDHYLFQGSLTTPPCTEGVQWIVMEKPIQASEAQIRQFRDTVGENARPVQPLGDRKIMEGED